MIAFDLQCRNGHVFEGWFENGEAFDSQKKKGLLSCPVCNDDNVSKIPTRFAIKASSPPPDPQKGQQTVALAQLGEKIYDFIDKNFDDVGTDFAKEALKIHYGVTEPRNIRGVSTQEEEKQLKKEGIDVFKFPVPQEKDDSDA